MKIKKRKRTYWNEKDWQEEIRALPEGLTLTKAAKWLGKSYPWVCSQLHRYGYQVAETRGGFTGKRKLTPAIIKRIDWSKSYAALGRKYDVTRERMRQVGKALGKPRLRKHAKPIRVHQHPIP